MLLACEPKSSFMPWSVEPSARCPAWSRAYVAFHFELAGHKGLLTVQLAFTKVREGVITDVDDTVSLALGLALVNGNILLQVNSLDELLASSILNVEFKDGICLLMC